VQDKRVIIELQEVFYVQYMSLDSLRSGKVQYYNRHIMTYNQAHNYDPAITLCNKYQFYPPDFVGPYVDKLSERIARDGDLNSCLLRGSFYINRQEYSKAIADFIAILDKEPRNLLALFNLANARVLMYDYIESVEDKTPKIVGKKADESQKTDYSLVLEGYNKCLEIDPDFVFALYNIANVYAKNGEIDRAISTYSQVIRKDKDLAEAYFNRGLLYIYTGQKALANADLSKAGELGIVGAYNIIKRYCKEN
ncbi:MAG: tetratricopeptide repeat protein, partial [Odoribacter sp.]|nr:tetratricopeptide repeat protein [Odoribacter sp.]